MLGALWRDSLEFGIVEPGENRYAGDLAEALVALGRLDEAAEVAGELERRGAELGRPAVLAVAARCRGLVAGTSGDSDGALEELSAAVALHRRSPCPSSARARSRRSARRSGGRSTCGMPAARWRRLARPIRGSEPGRGATRSSAS